MHISHFKTKKEFKEAISTNPKMVWLDDPAVIGAVSGYANEVVKEGGIVFVTNHPKRSWYAQVTRREGRYKIK